jgi:hypothetical protein
MALTEGSATATATAAAAKQAPHPDAEVPEVLAPETKLRRVALASALTEAGFPISPATLASMATRGNGPSFQHWGRIPLYTWSSSLEWARSRLSAPRANTSAAA